MATIRNFDPNYSLRNVTQVSLPKNFQIVATWLQFSTEEYCFSLLFLTASPSSPFRTLEELFELTRRTSRALNTLHALLNKGGKKGHRQVCCARHRGPRTPSITTDTNLDSAFVKNAFSKSIPGIKVNRKEAS